MSGVHVNILLTALLIIRRGREVTWAIPGLLILLAMKVGIGSVRRQVAG